MFEEIYDKWHGLPLPLRIMTATAAIGGAALTGAGAAAGIYAAIDPKGAKHRAAQVGYKALSGAEGALGRMDKDLPEDSGNSRVYGSLSSAGPGVAVGHKDIPLIAGADLTGVSASARFDTRKLIDLMKPVLAAKTIASMKRNTPFESFAGVRLSPTMFPLEAGILVDRSSVGRVKDLVHDWRYKLESIYPDVRS